MQQPEDLIGEIALLTKHLNSYQTIFELTYVTVAPTMLVSVCS